jgi:CheY-like chemotaxis protein
MRKKVRTTSTLRGRELRRTRRNDDFTVDVESQRPAQRMGRNTTPLPQVVKNRRCREKCATLTSLSWGTSSIIVMWGDQAMFNYPGRQTILCIDDDDGILRYQRALFERRGYKVLTAASARQGLQMAAACAVAAVIVDYHMPEMNGHEVATEIKRLRPQVPIVMLSSDDEIPELALNAVDAFVSKNEAPSRLLPVITRICGEKPSGFQESRITT